MSILPVPKPLVVAVLDGWGISFVEEGNAIAQANTPYMDLFAQTYPTAAISAAGIEVGLHWGEIGNSETGHSNIGAGQVQYQALPKIDKAVEDDSFFSNAVLLQTIEHARQNNSQLHLMGLMSPGGVHAHVKHLYALLKLLARKQFLDRVYLHMFTDGRDSPPQSALTYLRELENMIGRYGVGTVASVTGRFYAMDRNHNWDRTKMTYDLLTGGPREAGASSAEDAIRRSYQLNVHDEMIRPTAVTRGGAPVATIRDNDAVIFLNYRPDRARQLTQALSDPGFDAFERRPLKNVLLVTMTEYDRTFNVPAAFVDEPLANPLARVVSQAGLRQLHVAETEKYAHITYYLNGGHEQPFPGEDHVLIESSAVTNFADEPQMAAEKITDRILEAAAAGTHDVIFVNYANADMVGHTGRFEAAIEACQFLDVCLGRLYQALVPHGGALLITADHGNAEEMLHPQTGEVETDHTSNPVPFHFVRQELGRSTPRSAAELSTLLSSPIGVLADIAPTVLDILNVPKPPEMTGVSLLSSLN